MLGLIERSLIFKPTRGDHGGLRSLSHHRVSFGHDVNLRLDGVFVDNGSPSCVIFTHGNRHNITLLREQYTLFNSIGQSFFTFDYPGYGRSEGLPSENGAYISARSAYTYVAQQLGYSADQIALYGCSMGGAVAIDLALHIRPACLITEGTFTNTYEMAKHLYPRLPLWHLFPIRFRNDLKVPQITAPMLLIHGQEDPIVPARMGSQLYKSATAPAELIFVPHANHINSLPLGGVELQERIKDFLKSTTTKS